MKKKFKFKLEQVLKYRKIQENMALVDFAEASAVLSQEESKLEEFIKNRSEAFNILKNPTSATYSEGIQLDSFVKLQDVRIVRQKKKVEHHKQIVEELREILQQRQTEYKMIKEFKVKKSVEFKDEIDALEQKALDEISVTRFVHKDGT